MSQSTSVALGFFDGVHLGHRAVINEAIRRGAEMGARPVVFTFTIEDKKLISQKKTGIKKIQSDNIRFSLIKKAGADVISVPFNDIVNLEPAQFVDKILVKELNAKAVFCGNSYRFGIKAAGDTETLKQLCGNYGIVTGIVPSVIIEGITVSSTLIRGYLSEGEIVKANNMLGYNYFLQSKVTQGTRLGHTLGIPTVNQKFGVDQLIPGFGVYASVVEINGSKYTGATNIGVKPSVKGERSATCETHIIDFDRDLYGCDVKISLVEYLRPEKAFASMDELQRQIEKDIERIKKIIPR